MSLDLSISESTLELHNVSTFRLVLGLAFFWLLQNVQHPFSQITLTADSSSHMTSLTTHHSLLESLQVLLGLFAAVNLQCEFGEFGRLDRLLLLQLVVVALDVLQVQTQLLTRPAQTTVTDGRTHLDGRTDIHPHIDG